MTKPQTFDETFSEIDRGFKRKGTDPERSAAEIAALRRKLSRGRDEQRAAARLAAARNAGLRHRSIP